MRARLAALSVVAVLVLCGCVSRWPSSGPVPAGAYDQPSSHKVRNVTRWFRAVRTGQGEGRPLLVVLHGAFQTGERLDAVSGFSELGRVYGFDVLYPEGFGLAGHLQHFNAGFCCGRARELGVDDAAFALEAVQATARRLGSDPDRIFLAGYSNGGMLAYVLAAEHPEVFAGLALVAATAGARESGAVAWERAPAPDAPLPVMALHGRNDRIVPFRGGVNEKLGLELLSVQASLAPWIAASCGPDAAPETTRAPWGEQKTWCGGPDPVVLYCLDDWGHSWPGRAVRPEDRARIPEGFAAQSVIEFFGLDR